MIIEFLVDTDISGKIDVYKGQRFEAEEYDNDRIIIQMGKHGRPLAPKHDVGKIFKIVEG